MIGATELNNFFTNYEPPGGACVEKKNQISKILLNKIFQNSDFQKRSKKSACLHPEGQFFSTMGKLTT